MFIVLILGLGCKVWVSSFGLQGLEKMLEPLPEANLVLVTSRAKRLSV